MFCLRIFKMQRPKTLWVRNYCFIPHYLSSLFVFIFCHHVNMLRFRLGWFPFPFWFTAEKEDPSSSRGLRDSVIPKPDRKHRFAPHMFLNTYGKFFFPECFQGGYKKWKVATVSVCWDPPLLAAPTKQSWKHVTHLIWFYKFVKSFPCFVIHHLTKIVNDEILQNRHL